MHLEEWRQKNFLGDALGEDQWQNEIFQKKSRNLRKCPEKSLYLPGLHFRFSKKSVENFWNFWCFIFRKISQKSFAKNFWNTSFQKITQNTTVHWHDFFFSSLREWSAFCASRRPINVGGKPQKSNKHTILKYQNHKTHVKIRTGQTSSDYDSVKTF